MASTHLFLLEENLHSKDMITKVELIDTLADVRDNIVVNRIDKLGINNIIMGLSGLDQNGLFGIVVERHLCLVCGVSQIKTKPYKIEKYEG